MVRERLKVGEAFFVGKGVLAEDGRCIRYSQLLNNRQLEYARLPLFIYPTAVNKRGLVRNNSWPRLAMAGQWNPLERLGVAKGGAARAARTGQSKATDMPIAVFGFRWAQCGRAQTGRKGERG